MPSTTSTEQSPEQESFRISDRRRHLVSDFDRRSQMDDFAMAPMPDSARRDLLEILDDRHGRHSTIAHYKFPSRTGMACSVIPHLPTPFSTGLFTTRIEST
jgi:hypothetical protein